MQDEYHPLGDREDSGNGLGEGTAKPEVSASRGGERQGQDREGGSSGAAGCLKTAATLVVIVIIVVIVFIVAHFRYHAYRDIVHGRIPFAEDAKPGPDPVKKMLERPAQRYRREAPKDHSRDAEFFMECDDAECVKSLLYAGAQIQAGDPNWNGLTALQFVATASAADARKYGYVWTVPKRIRWLGLFTSFGADIDGVGDLGEGLSKATIVMAVVVQACKNAEEIPLLKKVIQLGARLDLRDGNGWTAVDYANRHAACVDSPNRERVKEILAGVGQNPAKPEP